jgi:hypothetical protein
MSEKARQRGTYVDYKKYFHLPLQATKFEGISLLRILLLNQLLWDDY